MVVFDDFRHFSTTFYYMSRLVSPLPFSVVNPLRLFVGVEGAVSLGLRHPMPLDASEVLSKSLIFGTVLDLSWPGWAEPWKIPFRLPVPNLSISYILPL